jgi:DNA (cytosine-5)-methyltransferase 1
LSSNNGRDFATVINEMAKAGAYLQEYALLDAQHFGIPQRRRRIFLLSCFDPATASICPSPLLPVSESLPRDITKGKPKRKSAATTLTEGFGAGSGIVNAICGETYHHGGITNQDLGSVHMVVEDVEYSYAESSFAQFKEGEVAALKASGGVLGGGSETLIVGALTVSDLTRQVTNEIVSKNLLQVVEPYVKARRAQSATDDETWVPGEVNPTLNSFDVGDTRATTAIIEPYEMVNRPVKDPVGTLQARVAATNHESIRDGHAIVEELMLVDGTRVDDVRVYEPPVQTLGARMGTGGNNVPVIGIQGNVIGRQPQNGPAGKGHTEEGDPMFTLTGTDVHAVAYDEYNDSINETHHALRAGTKQSTGVLTSPTLTAYNMDSRSPQSEEQQRIVNAVFESTMAVRRLTPLECERLMGWPDDHTRYKADGTEQADTHRYKQCGNGVASPVAKWVAEQIAKVEHAEG